MLTPACSQGLGLVLLRCKQAGSVANQLARSRASHSVDLCSEEKHKKDEERDGREEGMKVMRRDVWHINEGGRGRRSEGVWETRDKYEEEEEDGQ